MGGEWIQCIIGLHNLLCTVFSATGSAGTQFLLTCIFVSNDLAFVVNGQRIEDGGYALKLIYEIYDLTIIIVHCSSLSGNTNNINITKISEV